MQGDFPVRYVGYQRVYYIYSTSRHDQGMLYSAAEVLEIDQQISNKQAIKIPIGQLCVADVGGLEPWNFMTFQTIGNVILPTDELHHFSEGWLNHQPAPKWHNFSVSQM